MFTPLFTVIDKLHVETGSFNYSAAAASNKQEWQKLRDEGADLKAAY